MRYFINGDTENAFTDIRAAKKAFNEMVSANPYNDCILTNEKGEVKLKHIGEIAVKETPNPLKYRIAIIDNNDKKSYWGNATNTGAQFYKSRSEAQDDILRISKYFPHRRLVVEKFS